MFKIQRCLVNYLELHKKGLSRSLSWLLWIANVLG